MSLKQRRKQFWDILTVNSLGIVHIFLLASFISLVIIPLAFAGFGAIYSGQPYEKDGYLTLQNFTQLWGPEMFEVLKNTFIVSIVSTVTAMLGGGGIAFLVTRTRIPHRRLLGVMAYVPYVVPGYLAAIGWIFLMSPRIGVINTRIGDLLGFTIPFYNEWWIGFIVGTHYISLVYFLAAPGLKQVDSTLESASFVHGGDLMATFRSISLPLSKPALLSTLVIIFIKSFEEFAIALWIGLPTRTFVISTKIFNAIKFTSPPDYGPSTALALLLVALGIILLTAETVLIGAVEQYQTRSGGGFGSDRVYDFGPFKNKAISFGTFIFMFTVGLLPILMMMYVSIVPNYLGTLTLDITLDNYTRVFNYPDFGQTIINTLILVITGPVILMVSAFFSSYFLFKTELPGRRVLDYIMFLPLATPSVVTAVGFLWTYIFLFADFLPLYGTLPGIILALTARYVPYATRAMHSGMASIDDVLEEAALVSGSTPLTNLKDIIAPLITDNFVYGYILLSMFFIKNLTVVIFLYSDTSWVLSVLIWDMWNESLWGATAAASTLMTVTVLGLAYIALKIGDVKLS